MSEGRVRRAYIGIAGGSRPLPPRLAAALGRRTGIEVVAGRRGQPRRPRGPAARGPDRRGRRPAGRACRRPSAADGRRADRPARHGTRAPPRATSSRSSSSRPNWSDSSALGSRRARAARPGAMGRGRSPCGDPHDRRRCRGGVRRRLARPPARCRRRATPSRWGGHLPRWRRASSTRCGGWQSAVSSSSGATTSRTSSASSRTSRGPEPDGRRDRRPARAAAARRPRPRRSSACASSSPRTWATTHRELLWGSPGTMLVATRARLRGSLARLGREPPRRPRPGDGPLGAEPPRQSRPVPRRRPRLRRLRARRSAGSTARPRPPAATRWSRTASRTGRRHDDGALVRNGTIRVQWCHGAPGDDHRRSGDVLDEDLALAGGELTWRAGPLAKGAGLCHGTAGNGYAFLDALRAHRRRAAGSTERAGSPRTRSTQVERARAEHGRAGTRLWTGDLGIALYLADCVAGGGRLPLP